MVPPLEGSDGPGDGGCPAAALAGLGVVARVARAPLYRPRADLERPPFAGWARGLPIQPADRYGDLRLLPDFPWWAGLAGCYWFLCDERPAPRLLGTAWLLLSILTPFYHPYARLLLPLQAIGWLVMAALVRELAVTSRIATEVGSTGIAKPRWYGLRTRGVVALLCLALAAWQGLVLTRRASALRSPGPDRRDAQCHRVHCPTAFAVASPTDPRARPPVAPILSRHQGGGPGAECGEPR